MCLPEFVPMDGYEIIKAAEEDLQSVHDMAEVVFRHTYRDILSPEQMEYMMDWMYSLPNLIRQLEDGHEYFIALREGLPCGYVSVARILSAACPHGTICIGTFPAMSAFRHIRCICVAVSDLRGLW